MAIIATPQQLQRTRMAIQRRGGAANAPQYAQRLKTQRASMATPNPTVSTEPVAPGNPNRINRRISFLQKVRPNSPEIRILKKRLNTGASPTVETPTVETPVDNGGVTPPPVDNGGITPPNNNLETLFPGTRMFEPQNYEGSPLYKFQVQEGQKQLQKSLAARGLLNSGYGIEQELNIPMRAAAQDTDRMTRVASENAERLKSFMDNEALRRERVGNSQWDRMYNIAALMAQQSPWNEAFGAVGSTAGLSKEAAMAKANFLRDAYKRILSSGGGGGGFTPKPLPTGPDYSAIDYLGNLSDYNQSKGNLNLFTGLVGSLFPQLMPEEKVLPDPQRKTY